MKVPAQVRARTEARLRAHAGAHYAGKVARLSIRFHGQLCYVDVYQEPGEPSRSLLRALRETREQYLRRLRSTPLHLCRLRYFGNENGWSLAFYTYSSERYEPSVFQDGSAHGTPEAALDLAAGYLDGA